jgi:flagellin-like protein
MVMNKRGISPIIATVLLIMLALALVLILLLWASNFFAEKAQKNGNAVDQSCASADFQAEIDNNGDLNIENRGNVPLYGINLFIQGDGFDDSRQIVSSAGTITSGSTRNVGSAGSIPSGSKVFASPILLVEQNGGKLSYPCSQDYGKQIL